MTCPCTWTNGIDEEEDQGSSWESELEGDKAEEPASLEARDDEGEWCWPRRNRITRWIMRMDPRPAFHYLAEDDEEEQVSGGLGHLVLRNAGGGQWTWKKVHRCGRLGGGGGRDAEKHVSRNTHRRNIEVQEWKRLVEKGSKDQGERIKKCGQQVMSVRTSEGFVRKNTWQVADVRKPLVSAFHII